MIKIENVVTPSPEQWKALIFGARNAMNSWARSDSKFYDDVDFDPDDYIGPGMYLVGPNDYELMMRLRNAGTDHRKFMRMITVYLNIAAPLYWWKEFDTYKIGTVANSCSTMHKIHAKEFTLEDFSHEHLLEQKDVHVPNDSCCNPNWEGCGIIAPIDILEETINMLNKAREMFLETKDKKYWWQMIQLLPSSYNQKRTVMLNYEVLANIYKSRKDHKLDEWRDFCSWIETLPYSELITGYMADKEEK